MTGSADKSVKFWEFELVSHPGATGFVLQQSMGRGRQAQRGMFTRGMSRSLHRKQLALVHTRTLKMTDEVTAVCFSPNQKLLAVALLDTTVKVCGSRGRANLAADQPPSRSPGGLDSVLLARSSSQIRSSSS